MKEPKPRDSPVPEQKNTMAEKGKVKFYNWKKGFGFVTTDEGEDYFLHRSGIPQGTRIYQDDVVEFDIIDGPKGKNATNIKVLESKGPQPRTPQPEQDAYPGAAEAATKSWEDSAQDADEISDDGEQDSDTDNEQEAGVSGLAAADEDDASDDEDEDIKQ